MSGEIPGQVPVKVYPWPVRLLVGGLVALSGLGLPASLVILTTYPRLLLPLARALFEARLILVLSVAPLLVARALQWLCTARISCDEETVHVIGRALRIDIPRASIDRLAPWVVPLPAAGFGFVMRSGKRLRYGVEARDLGKVQAKIGVPSAPLFLEHPSAAYAVARQRVVWRWYHLAFKFALFPLLPGLLIFRLHQFITFGGAFGEYYLSGLRPYLTTLTIYVAMTCMDCLLWASLWRTVGEIGAFAATQVRPSASVAIRRAIEVLCSLLYYGGIAAMILYAFLR